MICCHPLEFDSSTTGKPLTIPTTSLHSGIYCSRVFFSFFFGFSFQRTLVKTAGGFSFLFYLLSSLKGTSVKTCIEPRKRRTIAVTARGTELRDGV
jgi:hypothetical protein